VTVLDGVGVMVRVGVEEAPDVTVGVPVSVSVSVAVAVGVAVTVLGAVSVAVGVCVDTPKTTLRDTSSMALVATWAPATSAPPMPVSKASMAIKCRPPDA
jgi:hypothetical protein